MQVDGSVGLCANLRMGSVSIVYNLSVCVVIAVRFVDGVTARMRLLHCVYLLL